MTDSPSPPPLPRPPAARERPLGLPVLALVGLALLAIPRAVLHDLGLVEERTGLNALLVALPAVVWIVVAVRARVPNPFLTLLVVGAISGVLLALTHQILWDVAFDGAPPRLGGNLAGLDEAAQGFVVRAFAVVSGVFTGIVVGAITGLVAWGVSALARRRPAG